METAGSVIKKGQPQLQTGESMVPTAKDPNPLKCSSALSILFFDTYRCFILSTPSQFSFVNLCHHPCLHPEGILMLTYSCITSVRQ